MKNKISNKIIALFFFLSLLFSIQLFYAGSDAAYNEDARADLLNQYNEDGDDGPVEIAGQGKRDYTPASAKPGWHHKFYFRGSSSRNRLNKVCKQCRSRLHKDSKEPRSVLHKHKEYHSILHKKRKLYKETVEDNLKGTVDHILQSGITKHNKHLIFDEIDTIANDMNDYLNKFIWKTVANIITSISTEVTDQILQQGPTIAQSIKDGIDPVEATNMAMQNLMSQIKDQVSKAMEKVEKKTDFLNDDINNLVQENIKNIVDSTIRTIVIHAVKEAFKKSIDMHKDMRQESERYSLEERYVEEQPVVEKLNIDELQPAM